MKMFTRHVPHAGAEPQLTVLQQPSLRAKCGRVRDMEYDRGLAQSPVLSHVTIETSIEATSHIDPLLNVI